MVIRAAKLIAKALREDGWTVVPKGGASRWAVMAVQEHSAVLEGCGSRRLLGTIRSVARSFARLADQGQRLVSRATIRHLAEIAVGSPAVCLRRAVEAAYGVSFEDKSATGRAAIVRLLAVCLGPLRLYFNRPTVQKIVRVHGRPGDYADRVLRYCRRAHVAAMWDEYIALLRNPGQCGSATDALLQVERVLNLGQGNPKLNVVHRGKLKLGTRPATSDYAMAFGEELETETSQASMTQRRTRVREAFNSPLWPFVLATTSVGQEGLDFHLYCQDVVHWNLPTNPVDFEQREGRVNRYAGMWVRRGIARDYPLATKEDCRRAPWPGAFEDAEAADTQQGYKHGLYPYWVYEAAKPQPGSVPDAIKRHLIFFGESEDRLRYQRLLLAVSLYRLVFGQPNQEELLVHLQKKIEKESDRVRALELLPSYIINLSPLRDGHAIARARKAAQRVLNSPAELRRLVFYARGRLLEPFAASDELKLLLAHVEEALAQRATPSLDVVAALEYLRDPFDDAYDTLRPYGLDDDAAVVRKAAKSIPKRPARLRAVG